MNGSMLPAAVAATVLLLDALRLRGRLRAIPALTPAPAQTPVPAPAGFTVPVGAASSSTVPIGVTVPIRIPAPGGAASSGVSPSSTMPIALASAAEHMPNTAPSALADRFILVTAAGVTIDDVTRRWATAHAESAGLRVLDLIPADLPMSETFTLARKVDPATYRTDLVAPGHGAGQALLVDADLAARAGVTAGGGHDPATMVRITGRLRKYATTDVGFVVTPAVTAAAPGPETFRARLRASAISEHLTLATRLHGYLLLVAAVLADPAWGLLALAAYGAQPYLVTAGTALRPADRHRAAWLRPVRDPLRWWRAVRGAWRSPYDREWDGRQAVARDEYARELAAGTSRFFEDRLDDCPWCGGVRLSRRVTIPDLLMGKPGSFALDQCGDCGHTFQNPRLNQSGLDFYYRDSYDGLGESSAERILAASVASYRGRVEMVRAHTTPRNWLDVGTGWAHFCRFAAAEFPGAVFEGLDLGDGVLEAERRGWIDRAHQGMFPDAVDRLGESYDVVSMHHYLEHTVRPRVEISAAVRVLKPGGHLLIEVPNPAFGLTRLLRGYWMPYFQPQHLNLIPLPRMMEAVTARGLTVVAVDTGRAHQPCDLAAAVMLWVNSHFPDPDRPWADRPATRRSRTRRTLAWAAAIPVLTVAAVLDRLLGAVIAHTGGGNCYRLLARKPAA